MNELERWLEIELEELKARRNWQRIAEENFQKELDKLIESNIEDMKN